MASKKNTTTVRLDPEVNNHLSRLKREIDAIQNAEVTKGEIIRRVFNHPEIEKVLKEDALLKKRFGQK